MKGFITIAAIFAATTFSHAGIIGCGDRFSSEMEYLLMNQCMGSGLMNLEQHQEKLRTCACYINSLAEEYNGSDEKLIKDYEKDRKIENKDKAYMKCSKNPYNQDEYTANAAARKAIRDAD